MFVVAACNSTVMRAVISNAILFDVRIIDHLFYVRGAVPL